ncbi:hypothetical protein WJ968_20065 [Achromobacter xylosoxidans]
MVAVVATVFTAGALAAPAGATLGGMMNLGVSVLAGTSTLSGIGAVGIGLAAGAVGSAVSQGVGMALGMQSKFSWGSVAMGALGSGVMAGVGGAFNGASFLSGNLGAVGVHQGRHRQWHVRRRQRHADGGAGDGQLDGDAGHRDGDGAAVQVQLDQCGGCRRGRGSGRGSGRVRGRQAVPHGE